MPSSSEAQRRAMKAAKDGDSALGIPQRVGEDFAAADKATAHEGKSPFATAMQHHGMATGKHKRHPTTSVYKGSFEPHRRGR